MTNTTNKYQSMNNSQIKRQIKAIIFDFDGLLVNTEELAVMAYDQFLGKRGIEFDHGLLGEMLGRPALINMKFLKERYNLEGEPEALLSERREITKALFEERMALMEGVTELLERVKNWSVKCAIASGGHREIIVPALKRLGVDDMFSVVVATEDLMKSSGKPDPEIFLLAAEKLAVKCGECIVLEDSPLGVEAAKAAGMRVVFVPDVRFTDPNHAKADVIIKSLHELTDEVMGMLVGK